MKRKRLITTAAGTLVAAAIASVAWASIPGPGNVYTACMLKGLGTIRLIDKSLPASNLMSRCTDKEIEISWNQAGQTGPAGPPGDKGDPGAPGTNGTNGTNGTDGKDGVSVTTASEPAGANCAGGGAQLTAANGVSYVCNGSNGADGADGAPGEPGRNGVSGYELVPEDRGLGLPPGVTTVVLSCPVGKRVLGGGYADLDPNVEVDGDAPTIGGMAWQLTLVNSGPDRSQFRTHMRMWAICADVS